MGKSGIMSLVSTRPGLKKYFTTKGTLRKGTKKIDIGFVENVARKYMQYEVIWITIFVMGMLGLLFDVTIRKIIDKTIPWRGKG